jgi:monomeric sarcosine oxidase
MSVDRRTLLLGLGAAAALGTSARRSASAPAATKGAGASHDVVVVGAGCFGSWIAWHLRRAGRTVLLLDAYGPANARASSGGESRVIRMSYGADEVYTRFSFRSLAAWKELFARLGRAELFQRTGVLWMALEGNASALASLAALERVGVPHERLDGDEMTRRYPQMRGEPGGWAIWEPESGALLARRAVQAVVGDAVAAGVELRHAAVLPPTGSGKLESVRLTDGSEVFAGAFVFACGPWLGKVVPAALGERIFPTRQEVFFFGVPSGDTRFEPPAMPVWLDFGQQWYGIPSLESRGFKLANDDHGEAVDPDTLERVVSSAGVAAARAFLARRFPALGSAPLSESRVCQYENTSNGDFALDRHPGFDNVWVAGGGSGHGFKHGPAIGEYVANLVTTGAETDPRFSLATKQKVQHRTVQ